MKYNCPACGDTLKDAGLLMYRCDMCEAVFDIEELTDDDVSLDDSTYTQDFDTFTDADPGL
jgi:tRNA(Ile2) C34 agmatinyltransferase TiaS